MRALIDHIRSYPSDHEIIINCRKGVVRSVATAMCLAMVTKNMTYDEALEYIDKKKEEIDPMWASMTNNSYKNYVRAFGQKHRIRSADIESEITPQTHLFDNLDNHSNDESDHIV